MIWRRLTELVVIVMLSLSRRTLSLFRTHSCDRIGRVRTLASVTSRALPSSGVTILPRTSESEGAANPLFSASAPTFAQLISSPHLRELVKSEGLESTTAIQSLSWPHIINGEDVILGAETGSGKTMAYFLPLLERYALAFHGDHGPKENATDRFGIVLAPSAPLCDQIVSMTSSILEGFRKAGFSVELSRWADSLLDAPTEHPRLRLIVCTPKSLVTATKALSLQEPSHPYRSLAFMVLDEADMLLDGSYQSDIENLLKALKLVRREQVREQSIAPHERTVQFILSAASMPTIGTKSIDNFAKRSFPNAVYLRTAHMHQHHPFIHQEFVPFDDDALCSVPHAQEVLRHLYRLRGEEVQEDVSAGPSDTAWLAAEEHSAMIFLNTAADAERFAASLRELGVDCVELHSLVTKRQREENLGKFRTNRVKLAVCTDACARGLDLPQVRRVVQADFALNVVQHLHRIGRASRGGRPGVALNFYGQRATNLVHSVLGAAELNYIPEGAEATDSESGSTGTGEGRGDGLRSPPSSTIESSFSRRRGFRRKLRRAQAERAQSNL